MKIFVFLAFLAFLLCSCDRPAGSLDQCRETSPAVIQPNDPECAQLNYVTYQCWFECEEDVDAFLGTRRVISVDDTDGFEVFYCSKDGFP
jgi:hypothetical protein